MPLLSLFFYFQKIIIFHKIYRFYKKERSTRETPSTRSPRPLQKNGLTWFFRLDSDNRIICLVITMLFIQYKSFTFFTATQYPHYTPQHPTTNLIFQTRLSSRYICFSCYLLPQRRNTQQPLPRKTKHIFFHNIPPTF